MQKPVTDGAGSKGTPSDSACPFCAGNGRCAKCGGSGKRLFRKGPLKVKRTVECAACAGSGECDLCHGSGSVSRDRS